MRSEEGGEEVIATSTALAISETLAACRATVYIEERSELHDNITKDVWKWVREHGRGMEWDGPVLDIGCGNGVALELFGEYGVEAIGITASPEEFSVCEKAGYTVLNWEMHDLSQLTNYASGIWLRHALEHSPMPLVLLRSCHAALRAGGWIYIETPAPGTASKHEYNPNHFSVLGRPMLESLILKAGFSIIDTASITFKNQLGDDEYFSFLAKKA